MQEIVSKPFFRLTKEDLSLLSSNYTELTGDKVCMSCRGELIKMHVFLKKHYMTTEFKLAKPFVIYKIQRGLPNTISNDKMTNELALEFLRIRPERISLFSEFPQNWKELLNIDEKDTVEPSNEVNTTENNEVSSNESTEYTKEELESLKMGDLRYLFPAIKATSKKDFISQILN